MYLAVNRKKSSLPRFFFHQGLRNWFSLHFWYFLLRKVVLDVPSSRTLWEKLKKNRRLTRELNTHTLGRTERLTGLFLLSLIKRWNFICFSAKCDESHKIANLFSSEILNFPIKNEAFTYRYVIGDSIQSSRDVTVSQRLRCDISHEIKPFRQQLPFADVDFNFGLKLLTFVYTDFRLER